MERQAPDKLFSGDADYLSRFIHHADNSEDALRDMEALRRLIVERIERTLDVQSAEIVVRGLIGQSPFDIGMQMELDVGYVSELLESAPGQVMHPSHDRLDVPIDIAAKLPTLSTAHAIAKSTGLHRRWTIEQLRSSDLETAEITVLMGRQAVHYNSEAALELIQELLANRPEPAGDWLTIGAMATLLDKDFEWVASRVRGHYDTLGVVRLDVRGRPSIHYPPEIFQLLKIEVESLAMYPVADETDYSMYRLSVELERDEKWLKARLDVLNITPKTKINPYNKRLDEYFTTENKNVLKQESERLKSYPIAGENDATVQRIAKEMGHDRKWVMQRLAYADLQPTIKMNPSNNQLSEYYGLGVAVRILSELPVNILKSPRPTVHKENVQDMQNRVIDFKTDRVIEPVEPIMELEPRETTRRVEQHQETARHFIPLRKFKEEPYIAPEINPTKEDWREYSECAQVDPELFFPDRGASAKDSKKICGQCAVTSFCLEYALETGQKEGIWGGKSAHELKALQKKAKREV